jgi:hypothetical protein
MTKDGNEVATAKGHGEGKMTEPGKIIYPVTIFYTTNSNEKLSVLTHLIEVNEYEVENCKSLHPYTLFLGSRTSVALYFRRAYLLIGF